MNIQNFNNYKQIVIANEVKQTTYRLPRYARNDVKKGKTKWKPNKSD